MVAVKNPNEISLGGTAFRIKGDVRLQNISVTPNPVVFGDTSKTGDTQVMSQLIQSTATGGSGVYKANPRTDTERCWTSTADTRYKGLLTLPPLTVDMGRPAGTTTQDVSACIDYRDEQYFVWANVVYRWLHSTSSWSTAEQTLASIPTDACVFLDKLFIAYGTGYDYRDSAGVWTTVGATPTALFVVWDAKLWRLGQVSGVWTLFQSTNGTTWSSAATMPSQVTPSQMIVFRDVVGATVIFAITDTGLWAYDADNVRWSPTEIQIPRLPSNFSPNATLFRDGKLYFTSGGMGMVSVQAGNPIIATPTGMDLDDGVPSEQVGVLSAMTADFNWILALIDSTGTLQNEDDQMSGMGQPFDSVEWAESSGLTTLRAWNGGWHTLWQATGQGTVGHIITVSSAYQKRRVYFGSNASAYYQDLPTTVYNPRFNPTINFAQSAEHITPWFDFGTEVQRKRHGRFYIRTRDCTTTEKITIYYGTDLDDDTWTLLGTVTTDGQHDFKVGGNIGKRGQFFRYKLILERGTDTTTRPIVEFWAAEFMRVLPSTYAFAVDVDLTEDYQGNSPAQLLQILKNLADPEITPDLIEFAYQDTLDGIAQTYFATISRMSGIEYAGQEQRGKGHYMVSLTVPYKSDAI